MGEIYEAMDLKLNRPVAIKTLLYARNESEELVRRLDREALAVARINHPNIVQIYDSGADQNEYYLAMERLYGDTLNKRINDQRLLDPGWVAAIGAQIAEAVHAAHKKGVIHRDLKPGNIFIVTSRESVDTVKVLDFGLAKLLDAVQVLTRTGQVFGTPTYMAPESLLEIKNASSRSDIYSIGCILYEMLTGRPPFEAGSQAELLQRAIADQPEPIEAFRDDIPEAFVKVIKHALEKRPADRLPNANILARALRDICLKYDQDGSSDSARYIRPKPPAKRSLAEVETLIDDSVYGVTQKQLFDHVLTDPKLTAGKQPAVTRKRHRGLFLVCGIILLVIFLLAVFLFSLLL